MAFRTQAATSSWLAAVMCAAGSGCSGPSLAVHSDGPAFVDGRAERRAVLPFRYYGTTLVDVVPADLQDGSPDWLRLPVRRSIALSEPVTPWVFPFDLPVELLLRLAGGAAPETVTATTVLAPEPVVQGFPPGGIEDLRARALAARSGR